MPLYFKRAVDAAGQGAVPGARQVTTCLSWFANH